MNRTIRNRRIGLAVVALAAAFFQFGNGSLVSPAVRAQSAGERFSFFTATQVFGLAQGQKARFCVGTQGSRGAALDWIIPISDERGTLLLQLPETHSPAGEWRCIDVPRSSLPVPGEPTTGRVQVAARHIVKAPVGTQSSQIIGSFEIVNGDGTNAGATAAIFYAAFHDNDF
jgi:hypothetical protein